MRRVVIYIIPALFLVTVYSCQKPLDIKTTDSNANVLVVEGFINTVDSTKIFLSRTVVIGNKTTANPEGGATITLENATGTVSPLIEKSKGYYTTPSLVLDNTKQYRIRIKTSNGKIYLSDLTDAKVTQPIDDVGYDVTNDGISIYAKTHDATNNSRYYLYSYEETWEFRTFFISNYRTNGTALVPRTTAEYVDHCYGFQSSYNIIVNSTAALTQDVVDKAPITGVLSNSEKLGIKYSILVTQTALTKEAYTFWDNLRKNTEKLGSIFDAQPSQILGNIHNVADASDPVIGYISAGTKQSKRIFIKKSDLPSNYRFDYPYSCELDTAYVNPPLTAPVPPPLVSKLLIPPNSLDIPIDVVINPLFAFSYSTKPCADCTIRGRVPKPSFWQ